MSILMEKQQFRLELYEMELEGICSLLAHLRTAKDLKNIPDHYPHAYDSTLSKACNIEILCEKKYALSRKVELLKSQLPG